MKYGRDRGRRLALSSAASTAQRHAVALSIFSFGLILGGIVTASAAWSLGGLIEAVPPSWAAAGLAIVAAAALLRDFDVFDFSLPQNARQVPRTIFEKGVLLAALQFGFELGTGLRSHVTSSLPYVLLAGLLLFDLNYLVAASAGVGFALGRAAVPFMRLLSRDGEGWDQRMADARWLVPTSSVSGLVLVWLVVVRV